MNRAILLVLGAGFVLVSGCCASAQVISDGGSTVVEDAKDSRLMQKVTLEETKITLPDLLKKLTQQTGVSMSVDSKPEFWQIRERKVHLFVKDATLQEVQDQLKKLFNYSWKRTGTAGTWEYQLYQSEVDRLRETNLMAAWQKQVDEKRIQQTAQVIDKFQKAQLLTPEQAAQYKESDPWTYLLATWGPAQAWGQIVMNLPLSAITQINQGQGYSMSYQEMNPQMQAWMKELVAGVYNIHKMGTLTDEDLQKMSITLGPSEQNVDNPYAGDMVAGVDLEGSPRIRIPGMDTETGRILAKMMIGVMEGKDLNESTWAMNENLANAETKQRMEAIPQLYSDQKPPRDPALLVKYELSLKTSANPLEKLLSQLQTETGHNMMADDYPLGLSQVNMPINLPLEPGKQPLYQILNNLGRSKYRTWSKEGNIILWQDPEWYVKRTWEVSTEWITYFTGKVSPDGSLGPDDLTAMANFSQDQIHNTLAQNSKLKNAADWVLKRKTAYNLYGSLKESQKKRAQSERGQLIASLSPKQQNLAIAAILDQCRGKDLRTLLNNAALSCVNQNNSIILQIHCGDGSILNWTLTMPGTTAKPAQAPGR